MIVKIIIILFGLLNGGWMLFDGVHVLIKGKYFGPEKPGPWSNVFSFIGIDPFKLGPLFVLIGISWIIFSSGMAFNQQWSWVFGIIMCTVTLWYLPIGTLISILIFVALIAFRSSITG